MAFRKTVKRYRALIDQCAATPRLAALIQKLVDEREGPSYTVDTPVVYNAAIDDFTPESAIKMILVGDNPGRREQAEENRRYLVGPSGKIAENFFRDNPELEIDFRQNVLILNKTPIHTPRTAELKTLCALGGAKTQEAVLSSQKVMAELLYDFWKAPLDLPSGTNPKAEFAKQTPRLRNTGRRGAKPRGGGERKSPEPRRSRGEDFEARGETSTRPFGSRGGLATSEASFQQTSPYPLIWIIGYSEMKKGGIFETYTETLKTLCAADPAFKESVYFFRHFSMNQFSIDLKKQRRPGEGLAESLGRIGKAYRERVLGKDD